MGTSHFDSSVAAKGGDETITGFDKFQADDVVCGTLTATKVTVNSDLTAPTVKATTSASTPIVKAHSYIQLGTRQYIFFGNKGTAASAVAAATALVGTPISGSLYMGWRGAGKAKLIWITSDSHASPVNLD
jgi:hypothetical protein